ncbi:MAG: hypothetical protein KatS3mg102_1463 [Planctomycetota bacterium]|nr:MAG: hypothetical protein KatS3mg102_1463 [Planctomycetota bacterium]
MIGGRLGARRWASRLAGVLAAAALLGCGAGSGGRSVGSATGGGGSSPAALGGLDFASIAQGEQSGITSPREELITDPIAFDAVWNQHTNNTSPAPRFNFHDYAIVGIFLGARPSPGYAVEVVRVALDAARTELHVTVREFAPGSWRRRVAVPTAPFDIVSIPRPPAGAKLVVHHQRRLDFEVLHEGAHSNIGAGDPAYQGELLAFGDLLSFDAFWQRHTSDPIPAVDFSQEMVVAVLGGYFPDAGHRVATHRLIDDPQRGVVRVDYAIERQVGGAPPPQQSETPFQILRVSRAWRPVRAEQRVDLSIEELDSGQQAAYQGAQPAVEVVRDAQGYDALYAGYIGTPPLQPLDPATQQAVFAMLGVQPSGGYSIRLARAQLLEDGELELWIETSRPTGPAASVLTSPYQVARLARTWGPVSFQLVDVTPRP